MEWRRTNFVERRLVDQVLRGKFSNDTSSIFLYSSVLFREPQLPPLPLDRFPRLPSVEHRVSKTGRFPAYGLLCTTSVDSGGFSSVPSTGRSGLKVRFCMFVPQPMEICRPCTIINTLESCYEIYIQRFANMVDRCPSITIRPFALPEPPSGNGSPTSPLLCLACENKKLEERPQKLQLPPPSVPYPTQ